MECERISIKEAAEILGVGQQLLRVQIRRRQGAFSKIGFAEKSETTKTWRYYVYKDKVKSLVSGE